MASETPRQVALSAWLCKFADSEVERLAALADCSLLFCLAEELYPEFEATDEDEDEIDSTVRCIAEATSNGLKIDAQAIRDGSMDDFEQLCANALGAAMQSSKRDEFVQSIMELSPDVQRELMQIIQEQQPDDDDEDEESDGDSEADGESADAADTASPSMASPVSTKLSLLHSHSPAVALLSPAARRQLDLAVADESEPSAQHDASNHEIGSGASCGLLASDDEAPAVMASIGDDAYGAAAEVEATARRRRAAAESSRHAEELGAKTKKIEELESKVVELQRGASEAASLRDQIDILRPAAAARQQAEAAVERLRAKLKAVSGQKEQIRQLEARNEELLQQTLELDRASKQVGPLKQLLEEAREGRCESEVRASELDVRLKETKEQLAEYKQAVEALRGERAGAGAGEDADGDGLGIADAGLGELGQGADSGDGAEDAGLGEGLTEFNPEVRARIRLLEEENRDLKDTRDAEAPERVRKLESQLDEQRRLRAQFEGKYHAASARGDGLQRSLELSQSALDTARSDLRAAQSDLGRCQADVEEWKGRHAQSAATCAELQASLEQARRSLTDTQARLEAAEQSAKEAEEAHRNSMQLAEQEAAQAAAAHEDSLSKALKQHDARVQAVQQEAEASITGEQKNAAEAVASAEARIASAMDELDAYRKAHSVSDEEAQCKLAESEAALKQEKAAAATLRLDLQGATEEASRLAVALQSEQESMQSMERKVGALEDELQQADARAQTAQRRLVVLQEQAKKSRVSKHADGAAGSQLQQVVDQQTSTILLLRKDRDQLTGQVALLQQAVSAGGSGGCGMARGRLDSAGSTRLGDDAECKVRGGSGDGAGEDEEEEEGVGGARRLRRGRAGAGSRSASSSAGASTTATGSGSCTGGTGRGAKDALLGDFETTRATAGGSGEPDDAVGWQASVRELSRSLEQEREAREQLVLQLGASARELSEQRDSISRLEESLQDSKGEVTSLHLQKLRLVGMLEREETAGHLSKDMQGVLQHMKRMGEETGARAGAGNGAAAGAGNGAAAGAGSREAARVASKATTEDLAEATRNGSVASNASVKAASVGAKTSARPKASARERPPATGTATTAGSVHSGGLKPDSDAPEGGDSARDAGERTVRQMRSAATGSGTVKHGRSGSSRRSVYAGGRRLRARGIN